MKKILNILKYYSAMLSSINTHTKNTAKNITKLKKEIKNLEEEIPRAINKAIEEFEPIVDVDGTRVSIVTATYNSEKYLEDYFLALIKQTAIDVKKSLEIIMVDDGSTDHSKEIIKKWENNGLNIKYVYQENQGQSAARNNGLNYVTTDWVTFIDSDDFVSENYFYNIFKHIKQGKSNVFVAPWEFYYEQTKEYKFSHPLSWRFKKSHLININENPHYINLPVNCVVFNSKLIKVLDIKFKDIKPNFEDAEYYLNYITKSNITDVFFIANIRYLYRKRADESSTMDLSKKGTRRFVQNLKDAYITTLEQHPHPSSKLSVLYDLRWNVEELSKNYNMLTDEEHIQRKAYLDAIFKYIKSKDLEYAFEKNLISINFFNLINGYYYNNKEIEFYSFYKGQNSHLIKLVCTGIDFEKIKLNGNIPLAKFDVRFKNVLESELGTLREYIVYVPYDTKVNYAELDGKKYTLERENEDSQKSVFNENSTLLFFDRINLADDNAEYLYRWFEKNKPEYKNKYFVLSSTSKDWNRLEKEGFNLVDYGSEEFEKLYKEGNFIFSSAGDSGTIENYERFRYYKYDSNIRFIFLQHGIIKDNLQEWLMAKRYDLMLATLPKEYEFLKNKVFNDEVVVRTGLPRYDNLLKLSKAKKEIILSLTWRHSLEGKSLEEIKNSDYYKEIVNIVTKVKEIDNILVILHPNMDILYDEFKNALGSECIKKSEDISYQDKLSNCKLLITDYSSIAFDAAMCKKNIIYYQFDKEEFYNSHTYKEEKEIFDYEKDGYGKVIYQNKELFKEIKVIKNRNYELEEKYNKRIEELLSSIDMNASANIFNEMQKKFK